MQLQVWWEKLSASSKHNPRSTKPGRKAKSKKAQPQRPVCRQPGAAQSLIIMYVFNPSHVISQEQVMQMEKWNLQNSTDAFVREQMGAVSTSVHICDLPLLYSSCAPSHRLKFLHQEKTKQSITLLFVCRRIWVCGEVIREISSGLPVCPWAVWGNVAWWLLHLLQVMYWRWQPAPLDSLHFLFPPLLLVGGGTGVSHPQS